MEKQKRNLVKDTLPLRKPIMIDGQSVSAVTYDSDEIDGILFATAESKRKALPVR